MSVERATSLAEAMVRSGNFRSVAVVSDEAGVRISATNRLGHDASISRLA